jgi:hypothetical protein
MSGLNIMEPEGFVEVCPGEIKPEDKRMEKMDGKEFLPKLPATFLVLGSCGSGKSSCLWSMMTKGYVFGDKKKKSIFDEMLIYLGTLDAKSSFEKFPCDNKLILTEFEPISFKEYQDDLQEHQQQRLDKGKSMLNTAVIFDDFFGANLFKKSKVGDAPPIEKLALTSRHLSNASIFYLSQAYKQSGFTSPSIRANLTTIILYKMPINETRKIFEEYAENYEVDELQHHYDMVMAEKPYSFIVWDRRRDMSKDRWTKGFTTPLPPSAKTKMLEKMRNGAVSGMEMKREESSDEE